MKNNIIKLTTVAILFSMATGCASYRSSSNISDSANIYDGPVVITQGDLQDKKYTEISPIEVSIKKATLFHSDPTQEQANEALKEKARVIGADAVINVKYKRGVGLTTWGYLDAIGMGVKTSNP